MARKQNRDAFGLGLMFMVVVGVAMVPSAHSFRRAPQEAPAANTPEFYATRVQPILQANCYRCHAGLNRRGGLQMDTRASLMRGGKNGVVIVPGNAEQSLLVKLIRHEGPKDDPMPMPPKSKLSDGDIATIAQWVQAGAVMPQDANANR